MDQQYDELYKVVLVGDPGVGKTNLLATFVAADKGDVQVDEHGVSRAFSDQRKPTIGVEFGTKIVSHPNGQRIKAQIWDTAGQERYRAITSSHYRRAAGALVVYDVSNRSTFDNAQEHWLRELKAQADPSSTLPSCVMLVGNKVDLDTRADPPATFVTAEQHETAAAQLGVLSQRASAKTGVNVRAAFEQLIVAIYDADRAKRQRREPMESFRLEDSAPSENTRGKKPSLGCCDH